MSLRELGYVETAWRPRTRRRRLVATAVYTGHQLRRALNVAVAALILAATAPLMILIAVLIKLTSSPGPVLYTQVRVGWNRRNGSRGAPPGQRRVDFGGRLFRIYKFRTMYVDGASDGTGLWAQPNDPRVTPVGRVLRKYRLDELPQLFNVLQGDMDVVGPRPEQPSILFRLCEQIEGFGERQRVRPGITGWAQVRHHYGVSLEDMRRKLELDLEYIRRQSVTEDLKILLLTVPVVLLRKGAW